MRRAGTVGPRELRRFTPAGSVLLILAFVGAVLFDSAAAAAPSD